MKKLHNNGFGLIAISLTILVIGIFILAGYYVWSRQNNESTQRSNPQSINDNKFQFEESETKQEEDAAEDLKKTIIEHDGTRFSIMVPESGAIEEYEDLSGEHYVVIKDVSADYTLTVQLLNALLASNSSTSEDNISLQTIKGYQDNPYHIHGYQSEIGSSYDTVYISACTPRHCYTKANDDHVFNFSIRKTDHNTRIALDEINTVHIEQILQSITVL